MNGCLDKNYSESCVFMLLQALSSAENASTVNGLVQLVAMTMAFAVAVIPKPDWQQHAVADEAEQIPKQYDPAALERYYSRRPFQCLKRGIEVSVGFIANFGSPQIPFG